MVELGRCPDCGESLHKRELAALPEGAHGLACPECGEDVYCPFCGDLTI